MAALLVAEIFGHILAEEIQGDRLSAIVDLAYAYPEFAVAVKRANDRNLPLWLLIAFFGASALLDLLTVLGIDRHRRRAERAIDRHRIAVHGARSGVTGRAWFSQGHGRSEPVRP